MTTTSQMTVTYKDHMGSDLSVVNAARVSFAKESAGLLEDAADQTSYDDRLFERLGREEYTELLRSSRFEEWYRLPFPKPNFDDWKLIHFLARHNHWTPFGHTAVTLHVKAPIFIARQLAKHQVGLVWNEVSRRYVDDEPEFYVPEAWRKRPADGIKQGSSDETIPLHVPEAACCSDYLDVIETCDQLYAHMITLGVAPEMARMVLPQSMMTEWYWTGSIAAFARVYKLRIDPHAQKEVQEIASKIDNCINQLFPVSWEALKAA